MVQRFQIEDIVVQDSSGIVFRALDTETGRFVALRRFFPFGPHGGGLDEDEQVAYNVATAKLSAVSHPALRSVICGGCDPVDGMPFLATEWIEGTRLGSMIAHRPLSATDAIELLDRALDVCEVLSGVLEEEAVWVETDLKAIVFGAEGSGRGATFWISPLQWLGERESRRGLDSIVKLTENMMDWHGKVVTTREGRAFGEWLRWLRGSAKTTTLAEARARLAAARTADPDTLAGPPEISSRKGPGGFRIVGVCMALLLAGCGAWLVKREEERQRDRFPSSRDMTRVTEMATTHTAPSDARFFSPADHQQLIAKHRGSVAMQGELREMHYSDSRKLLYLMFSSDDSKTAARAGFAVKHADGNLAEISLARMIGKTIRLRGELQLENACDRQRPLIMIDDLNAIELVK